MAVVPPLLKPERRRRFDRTIGWAAVWLTLALPVAAGTATLPPAQPEITLLRAQTPPPQADRVSGGALDATAVPLPDDTVRGSGIFWLKVAAPAAVQAGQLPVVTVHAARPTEVQVFAAGDATPLPQAATLPAYRGMEDRLFVVPAGGRPVYVRIATHGAEARGVRLAAGTLKSSLDHGAVHARMIALVVGGLSALSLASLLIWFVLADRLFLLYPTFFLLQALYVGFLSGQAFEWPLLGYARPLGSFAWNVPVALSGAAGCLFAREIADLKHFAPRMYEVFGGFAWTFLAVTVLNVAKLFGVGPWVNGIGNLVFCVVSVFTLVVALLSWRSGNRAAGWFLIAWGLLEGFTIAAAVLLLVARPDQNEALLYYGLPLSMLAAAVLIALGVADRLRQQRVALTAAERLAQTDALTGVLNRRSLIERLDAACVRARARGLPIAVLFIDLDHFKLINDSFGHLAGDACLRAIIAPIQAELRQSDVIGRYGGEEFVVVLSGADAAAARLVAERIRDGVANVRVVGFGKPIGVTCSIGVATSDALGVWGEQLISRADAAVYDAKRGGRNQVQIAPAAAA